MRCTGVMPLGISDHFLVYATLKLGSKRPPPKIIRTRNFKNFNAANFKADIEKIPFHILDIFHHKDDTLWGWEQLCKYLVGDSYCPIVFNTHLRVNLK